LLGATIVPLDKRLSRRDNRFLQVVEGRHSSGAYVPELTALRGRKTAGFRSLNQGGNDIAGIELSLKKRLISDHGERALCNLLSRDILA